MNLHVEVSGRGEPLVMLHGWGMHGGIWGETVARLAEDFTVHNVDLPGHGASGSSEAFVLEGVVDELAARFGQPLALLGWSLGGIIAQQWALREPHKINRMVLVASTPCFTRREDWPFGMAAETLAQFSADLEQDHAATLRRFLALQVRGSENERALLAALRTQLFGRGEPQLTALRGGLEILRDTDLRTALPRIEPSVLVIAGERDKLTPPEASRYLAETIPDARVVEIAGAAHAPFLSHTEVFVEAINDFLKGCPQILQI
ncbi:MAG: pimeloyl-ACP methyl ester esterase BioH [Gallionella sp.]|nr:pimeloyl-ACP methyl ester esterase BioH [Gallionella sp.]